MTYQTIYRFFSLILDDDSIGVKDKYITFREKNAHNLISFKEELAKIKWTEMPGLNDPSRALMKSLLKITFQFMIDAFHSKK